MSLDAVIVNPPLTIGDYKWEDIVSFFPVLEEELIRNICFKIFETYILSCQFRNIYVFKKVNIFRREYRYKEILANYETPLREKKIKTNNVIRLRSWEYFFNISCLLVCQLRVFHLTLFFDFVCGLLDWGNWW